VVILGSTGSIGKNALALCEKFDVGVEALSCAKNIGLLNEQILKFMNEHITALNLVLNEVQPKFSSLLRNELVKVLKFVKKLD